MTFLKKNFNKIIWSVYFYFISFGKIYAAQVPPCPSGTPSGTICNPISQNTLSGLIKTFLTGILRIGIPLIALAIIYCGFLFVAARGNSEKLSKAKDALLYTLIGSAILLGSWAIAQIITETVIGLSA